MKKKKRSEGKKRIASSVAEEKSLSREDARASNEFFSELDDDFGEMEFCIID